MTRYAIRLSDKLDASIDGVTLTIRGIVACLGPDNQRIVPFFLADESPVPGAAATRDGSAATSFLPREMTSLWVDLVRNEEPLDGYTNTDLPEWTKIATAEEAVGEEEPRAHARGLRRRPAL